MNISRVINEFAPGRYELKTVIPTDQIGAAALKKRREIGKGFTRDKNMRHVAEVPLDELVGLGHSGCDDAVSAVLGDDKAMKRLIQKHPEWQVCEGDL